MSKRNQAKVNELLEYANEYIELRKEEKKIEGLELIRPYDAEALREVRDKLRSYACHIYGRAGHFAKLYALGVPVYFQHPHGLKVEVSYSGYTQSYEVTITKDIHSYEVR